MWPINSVIANQPMGFNMCRLLAKFQVTNTPHSFYQRLTKPTYPTQPHDSSHMPQLTKLMRECAHQSQEITFTIPPYICSMCVSCCPCGRRHQSEQSSDEFPQDRTLRRQSSYECELQARESVGGRCAHCFPTVRAVRTRSYQKNGRLG